MKRLTEQQQQAKQDTCLAVTGACMALALWAGLWTLEALIHGAVSVLHLVVLVLASYGVRLFWRIAMSE